MSTTDPYHDQPDDVTYRLPVQMLLDLEIVTLPPANNAPHYAYGKGSNCTHNVELPVNESTVWCPICRVEDRELSQLRKVFTGFAYHPGFQAHYNYSAGTYVRRSVQLDDHFKKLSDARTERLGMEHKFVQHDPRDMQSELGVTEEGLDATRRRMRDSGETRPTTTYHPL